MFSSGRRSSRRCCEFLLNLLEEGRGNTRCSFIIIITPNKRGVYMNDQRTHAHASMSGADRVTWQLQTGARVFLEAPAVNNPRLA